MFRLGSYQKGTPAEGELWVSEEDWNNHCHVIGASGAGKTNFLYYLTSQAQPFCFIDAEGISARTVADSQPCIYWRARDYDFPVALNLLQDCDPDDRDERVAEIVSLFWDVWDLGEHNPLLNDYLSASIRLLLDTSGSTLIELYRVLTDEEFRGFLLLKCKDAHTRHFWRHFDAKDERLQDQQISSTLNKANALARSLPLRLALGQSTSTLNIRDIIDTGKRVVVDLSGIGAMNRRLLGAVIIFAFVNSASKRPTNKPQYSLIVDEFEDYIAATAKEALSKSRKRGLSLTLAHQFLHQLAEDVRAAIFANVGTFICFRVWPDDADIMARQLDTAVANLTHLPRGKAFARAQYNGQPWKALHIDVPRAALKSGHLDRNIKTTQQRYARTREKAQYQMNWWQRVQWARRQNPKDGLDF